MPFRSLYPQGLGQHDTRNVTTLAQEIQHADLSRHGGRTR